MVTAELSNEIWFQICEAYQIATKATVVPLKIAENRIYLISFPGGGKQVLRLYHPETKIDQIQSELSVLEYLAQEPDLKTSLPIAAQNGHLLTAFYETNNSVPTPTAMFSYVSGKSMDNIISPEKMFLIGQTLGQLDLTLQKADDAIKPQPSAMRRHWDGKLKIDWSLSKMLEHQTEYNFLNANTSRKQLHPTILKIANRLRGHLHKLHKFLPQQLLHGDSNLSNLLFDGTRIGIIDFNNMCYGPRIWELAPPLYNVHDLEVLNIPTHSSSTSQLTEALLDSYAKYIKITEIELHSFFLIQALRLFVGLGWEVSRRHSSREKKALEHSGAARINQISTLLKAYENKLILGRFRKPNFRIDRFFAKV